MLSRLKSIIKYKKTLLFLFFFTFYLTINVFLILSTNSNVFDYFFQSDSPRVMSDMIMVYGDHYRFYVHPQNSFYLFLLPP